VPIMYDIVNIHNVSRIEVKKFSHSLATWERGTSCTWERI